MKLAIEQLKEINRSKMNRSEKYRLTMGTEVLSQLVGDQAYTVDVLNNWPDIRDRMLSVDGVGESTVDFILNALQPEQLKIRKELKLILPHGEQIEITDHYITITDSNGCEIYSQNI